MRSPMRLVNFYDKLRKYHKCVPDWRFGQFMINFLDWHKLKFGVDVFYLEEEDFLQRMDLFMREFTNPDLYEDDD